MRKKMAFRGASGFLVLFMLSGTVLFTGCPVDSPAPYTVTTAVSPAGGGTVTANPAQAEEGAAITLNATANNGYYFLSYASDDIEIPAGSGPDFTFTMPAKDVTITGNFAQGQDEYSITAAAVHGGITAPETAYTGHRVDLTIVADAGYTLNPDSLKYTPLSGSGVSIKAVSGPDLQHFTASFTISSGTPGTVAISAEFVLLVRSITMSPAVDLVPGGKVTLTPVILPADAYYKELTWASSDEKVASVSRDGVVIAAAARTADITATEKVGGAKGTAQITVKT